MKLPKQIQGIQREGRSDAFGYTGDSGIEPQLIGKWINRGRRWICKKGCKAAYAICKRAC